MGASSPAPQDWLLFFYSVPSKPVANRMRIWRMLSKAGALQLKGSVYILPYSADHHEFFHWLTTSVAAMQGEADFVRTAKLETMQDAEVVALFHRQREKEYAALHKRLDELHKGLAASGRAVPDKWLDQFARCRKEFDELQRTDFFASPAGRGVEEVLQALDSAVAERLEEGGMAPRRKIVKRKAQDYQGRTWVTRTRPFVDRIASAWFIRTYIDPAAVFAFVEGPEAPATDAQTVYFDIQGGEFTHVGELTTFEVLIEAFGARDKALKTLSEIIHQIDLADGIFQHPEAEGVRRILEGIRVTATNDHDLLEKGMAVMDWLYSSRNEEKK